MASWLDGLEEVKLIGGFHCRLSVEEKNQWHEYITAHEIFKASRTAEIKAHVAMAKLKSTGSDEGIALVIGEADRLHDDLYRLGKDWYAGLQERRASSVDASSE